MIRARIRSGSIPFDDAMRRAKARRILPMAGGTEDVRRLAAATRARSVFIARGTSAEFLGEIRDVTEKMFAGEMTRAEARMALKDKLAALGYTPQGGFPGTPAVPPAVAGSLRDIASDRRLNLILETQWSLIANASYKARVSSPKRAFQFPWFELLRIAPRRVPRGEISGSLAWPRRFVMAGGKLTLDQGLGMARMIAGKFSPVWEKLGSSAIFDDALDVATPPFAFRSGFGWREVSRSEGIALGLDPEEETQASPEGSAGASPRLETQTAKALPAPVSVMVPQDKMAALLADLRATEAKEGRPRYNAALERDLAAAMAKGGAQ